MAGRLKGRDSLGFKQGYTFDRDVVQQSDKVFIDDGSGIYVNAKAGMDHHHTYATIEEVVSALNSIRNIAVLKERYGYYETSAINFDVAQSPVETVKEDSDMGLWSVTVLNDANHIYNIYYVVAESRENACFQALQKIGTLRAENQFKIMKIPIPEGYSVLKN